MPCFFHFTALKVYRRQRQVLWQQSVTTILSNIPTFLYFPCSYYICDTNTCFWWQHSLPLPFPRRYWKRWNYSLKEWIIGFVNESYARICRIPMHIISRLPNQLQSHQFIFDFFAFKIRTFFPILGYLFLNLSYNYMNISNVSYSLIIKNKYKETMIWLIFLGVRFELNKSDYKLR